MKNEALKALEAIIAAEVGPGVRLIRFDSWRREWLERLEGGTVVSEAHERLARFKDAIDHDEADQIARTIVAQPALTHVEETHTSRCYGVPPGIPDELAVVQRRRTMLVLRWEPKPAMKLVRIHAVCREHRVEVENVGVPEAKKVMRAAVDLAIERHKQRDRCDGKRVEVTVSVYDERR